MAVSRLEGLLKRTRSGGGSFPGPARGGGCRSSFARKSPVEKAVQGVVVDHAVVAGPEACRAQIVAAGAVVVCRDVVRRCMPSPTRSTPSRRLAGCCCPARGWYHRLRLPAVTPLATRRRGHKVAVPLLCASQREAHFTIYCGRVWRRAAPAPTRPSARSTAVEGAGTAAKPPLVPWSSKPTNQDPSD